MCIRTMAIYSHDHQCLISCDRHVTQVNNAGCMVNEREVTDDGLEKNFATNTLGIYTLCTQGVQVLSEAAMTPIVTN